jgi:hypothetical protein
MAVATRAIIIFTMLALRGVARHPAGDFAYLKKRALLFDDFLLLPLKTSLPTNAAAELAYLEQQRFLTAMDDSVIGALSTFMWLRAPEFMRGAKSLIDNGAEKASIDEVLRKAAEVNDFQARVAAMELTTPSSQVVPLCELPFSYIESPLKGPISGLNATDVLEIAIESLPTPSEETPWEDIFAFKAEHHDKLWHYRRFVHKLANSTNSEAEVRDEIEWALNEYTRAMRIHDIKAGHSLVETYVIPTIETIADIAKFN